MRLIEKNGKKIYVGRKHRLQKNQFIERCAMFMLYGRENEVEQAFNNLNLKDLRWCLRIVREELLTTLDETYTRKLENVILRNLNEKNRKQKIDSLLK